MLLPSRRRLWDNRAAKEACRLMLSNACRQGRVNWSASLTHLIGSEEEDTTCQMGLDPPQLVLAGSTVDVEGSLLPTCLLPGLRAPRLAGNRRLAGGRPCKVNVNKIEGRRGSAVSSPREIVCMDT
eukprot:763897-Hanusia_phi.AAC.3